MTQPRSTLAPFAASMREPNPEAAIQAARAAWRDHGIVLLNPDEIEKRYGWAAAQEVRNLGTRYLGERK